MVGLFLATPLAFVLGFAIGRRWDKNYWYNRGVWDERLSNTVYHRRKNQEERERNMPSINTSCHINYKWIKVKNND